MSAIALVTGASSGFGRLIANELAAAGVTAYASFRDTRGKNTKVVNEIASYAKEREVDLRSVELDVQSDESVQSAVDTVLAAHGRLDILVHNAGHMVYGPSEAFTTEQLAELYDINVLGTQRVNRAVLPHMRKTKSGLLVWISSGPESVASATVRATRCEDMGCTPRRLRRNGRGGDYGEGWSSTTR